MHVFVLGFSQLGLLQTQMLPDSARLLMQVEQVTPLLQALQTGMQAKQVDPTI